MKVTGLMVKQMGRARIHMPMARVMKESGEMICSMDRELRHLLTSLDIKAVIKMDKNKEKEPISGLIVPNMKVSGRRTKEMELVFISIQPNTSI